MFNLSFGKVLKKQHKQLLLCLFVSGLCLQAQASIQPRNQPLKSDSLERLAPASRKAWLKHLADSPKNLQQGCSPYYLAPKGSSPTKGAIILLHGFTACTQQNDGLALLLAQDGFHVFVPRLPGHGLPASQQNTVWHDHLDLMPEFKDYTRYQSFAAELSSLVKREPGLKSIAGVSLGGSLAASAILQAPGVFDRGILMTPVFDIVEPQNRILPFLQALTPKMRMHWGKTCDLERGKNRGGIL